jgi:2-polyprenyl-3-methyl-5-hydroxy-6-metoxy-1,4-benzoquinol methylase
MPSSANQSDRRNLDAVATILRQRVTPESRFYALMDVSPDHDPLSAGSFDRALPFTARLSRVTDAGQPQIGDMPPQPPTLRARVGAVLVGIVRRMLFWYTEQIRALQKRIAEAAREQAQAFQELSAAERLHRAELGELTQRLTAQEQHLQQADDRVRALAAQADRMRIWMEQIEHAHAEITHARAFRGARAGIQRRLAVYVPYAQKAYAAAGNAPALDLGCGRGEWLEVLREAGIPARGIDGNREFVDGCRELGLDAIEGDVPQLLRSLPAESLSSVTAIHLLEHLSFQDLLEVIDHAARILKPGGIAIFETPNPLSGELLAFVVEARGLHAPEIIPLNEHSYGPQDYGIVAHKPRGRVTPP